MMVLPLILLGLGWYALRHIKSRTLRLTADRQTAEDRRNKCPPGVPIAHSPSPVLLQPGFQEALDTEWGWYSRENGKGDMYWQTVVPKDKSKIERVLVCFHGYADHSDYLQKNTLLHHAALFNSAVIGFDMPHHGRSDGLHIYIEDWFQFVDAAIEFVDNWAQPQRERWSQAAGRKLKLFGQGESMGGGVLTTICLKHPSTFDGIVLSCPMLHVSEKLKPPKVVQFVFKHVLVHLFPDWPIAPTKEIISVAFTDLAQCDVLRANPLGSGGSKVRLRTAYSLGFVGTPWISANMAKLEVPFLVIHGSNDVVTDPEYSQMLYDSAVAKDKKIILYDGAMHADLWHGGPKCRALVQKVAEDVGAWMRERS